MRRETSAEHTQGGSRRKKIATTVAVGLLAAGLAGGGALVVMNTVLSGNEFTAQVTGQDAPVDGALLQISGDPLVHTFDTTRFNDRVEGTWTLSNDGTVAVPYDGTLAPTGALSQSLAENLSVWFGQDNGSGDITWQEAGTLAAPVSYAEALHLGDATIDPGEQISIPVRVVLADPTRLDGDVDQILTVNANFTVDYIDPTA